MAKSEGGAPNKFKDMPRNLQSLVEGVGFAEFVDMSEDEASIYDRVRHGLCMTCEGHLGKNSNFIISRIGIVGGYCSGQCHSDMAVLGFLQEQHDDITSAIKFRGGGGDGGEGSE